jgi:hypothetical protein
MVKTTQAICHPGSSVDKGEAAIYNVNKDQFLNTVQSYFDKGSTYFFSSFEGRTQVTVEFASNRDLPMIKLSNVVAAARIPYVGKDEQTIELEDDQLNMASLEDFLNRYEGNSLIVKDNYTTTKRTDSEDIVANTIRQIINHYEGMEGKVFLFGQNEPSTDTKLLFSRSGRSLVEFVQYETTN